MNVSKGSPKDVFSHLLAVIALYISAGSLISILFDYINLLFPDVLNYYSYSSAAGSIRGAMAALIIVFPFYLLVSWLLNKDYKKNPEKRDLKIRKWLIHFTLFVAALMIAGDLVALVYNFLGGELTARFTLKILAILIVAGAIFSYYILDLRREYTAKQLKILTGLASAIMLGSIVAGFFTAGSPLTARLQRFDERRLEDLQILQNEIINYWIQKEKLPANLGDLKNNISGFEAPADPDTNLTYNYKVSGKLNFELCADFNLPSPDFGAPQPAKPRGYYGNPYGQNWAHGTGKTCFERAIDPELYRPKIKS